MSQTGRYGEVIRRAKLRDVPQITANTKLVAAEGRYIWIEEVNEDSNEHSRRLIEDKGCLLLVAEVGRGKDKRVVGHLAMTRYGHGVKKSQHVRVLSMLIVEGHRDRGLGSMLISHAIDWAKKEPGVEKVVLGVFSNNQRALHVYEKFGFGVEGVRKDHYYIDGKREDEIDMALFVKPTSA